MLCKQILGSKNWDIGLWNYEQYIMLEPLKHAIGAGHSILICSK